MIRTISPSAERFLADLERIQRAGETAMRQISSGLRVTRPSDAPDQIGDILQLHASLARNTQISANLGRATTEVDTAERALEHSVKLVDRATVLASQAATTTLDAANRQILGGEVQALLEQLLGATRTTVEGRYIFSGDRDQEPAYAVNLANPNGVDRLFTAPASRRVAHPSGTSFSFSKTAEEIFDHRNADDSLAPDNVFAALNRLRIALEANDQAGIDASLTSLRRANDYLNSELSYYGTVQGKLAEALEFASKSDVQLRSELSTRQDADLTAAALELQSSQTRESAALEARARLPQTSLLDFLR